VATVGDVIGEIYLLLQDVDRERYDVDTVYTDLNNGLLEAKRLRPDFWRGTDPPEYGQGDSGSAIDFPSTYKPALVNYVVGRVLLRDREDSTDQRAAILLNTFSAKLTVLQA
jgi:hypothetical protein